MEEILYKKMYQDLLEKYHKLENKYYDLLNGKYDLKSYSQKETKSYKKYDKIIYEPIEGEVWKKINKFPDYSVSNLGRVRKENIILNEYERNGYKTVSIVDKQGKRKTVSVHRLVGEAFIPNPENKPQIDHINTVRNDNRVENLRWVSVFENITNPLTLKRLEEYPSLLKKVVTEAIEAE